MGLSTTLLWLSILAAQGPSTADALPQEHHGFATASLLPPDSLAVVTVEPIAANRDALARSPFGRMLDELRLDERVALALREATNGDETLARVVQTTLDRGVTLAWTGLTATEEPTWLVVASPGDTTEVVATLERATAALVEGGALRTTTVHADMRVERFERTDGVIAWSLHTTTGHLFLGSDVDQVVGALDRTTTPSESLATSESFRDFANDMAPRDGGSLLGGLYVDCGGLLRTFLPQVPAPMRPTADALLDGLSISRIRAAGWATHVRDDAIVDHFRIVLPEPRGGVAKTLLAPPESIDTDWLTALAPADATSFSVQWLDVADLVEELLTLATAVDPGYGAMGRGMLRSLGSDLGIDVERDILATLGREYAVMQWADNAQAADLAIVARPVEPLRLETALRKIDTLRVRASQGYQIFEVRESAMLPPDSPRFALAIDNRHIVITTDARIESMLTHLRANRAAHSAVSTLLANPPAATLGLSWSDLGASLAPTLDSILDGVATNTDMTPPVALTDTLRAVLPELGELTTVTTTDSRGVSIRATSPTGNLLGLALTAAASALPEPGSSRGDGGLAARGDGSTTAEPIDTVRNRMHGLLTTTHGALVAHREEHDGGYPSLNTLVAAGTVPAESLGEPLADGSFRNGDHVVSILRPDDEAERAQHFAIVAWPAESATGDCFAITTDGQVLVNEFLAHTAGVDDLRTRDVYTDGVFGAALSTGWQPLEVIRIAATDDSTNSGTGTATGENRSPTSEGERAALELILTIEASEDEGDAERLLQLLDSPHDRVAARAAWACGERQLRSAVPTLGELVATHSAVEVRQHSIEALRKLADARSLRFAIDALADEDAQVRTLAAATLGRLGNVDAVEPLLTLLASPSATDTERSQALLSLVDLRATTSLLAAASAVGTDPEAPRDDRVDSALVFLFQTLSPQAEDELTVLVGSLGHASQMLRRYALQRIVELGDAQAAPALEARLATEEPELRPLVELALDSVRGTSTDGSSDDASNGDSEAFDPAALLARVRTKWDDLGSQNQMIVAGSGGGVLLILFGLLVVRRRRRRARQQDAWADMVHPSEELAEDEYDDEYGDDYADDEFADEDDGYSSDALADVGTADWSDEDVDAVAGPQGQGSEEDPWQSEQPAQDGGAWDDFQMVGADNPEQEAAHGDPEFAQGNPFPADDTNADWGEDDWDGDDRGPH